MQLRHAQTATDKGYTVVEMMITLVVAAVLMTVIVPAFTDLIANNRMRSNVYELRGLLMEARSTAMTERRNVTLCRSSNGTSCAGDWNTPRLVEGYIAFVDSDGDGTIDAADGDRVVLTSTQDDPMVTLAFDNTADRVTYNSRGNAQIVGTDFNGTFTFCDKRGPTRAGGLIVSLVGTVSAAVDSDSTPDEIANDAKGVNLDCP